MDKYLRQTELEIEMLSLGSSRYDAEVDRARKKGEAGDSTTAAPLMTLAIAPVAERIRAFKKEWEGRGQGRRPTALKYLKMVRPEVAAFLALKVCLGHIFGRAQGLSSVVMKVAQYLEDEVRFQEFSKAYPAYFGLIRERLLRQGRGYNQQRSTLLALFNRSLERTGGDMWATWPATEKVQIGDLLVRFVVEETGLVTVAKVRMSHKRTKNVIRPTDTTVQWLEERHAECAVISPVFLPMVVPPKDWTTPSDGGYLTSNLRPIQMVKTRNRRYLEDLENWRMESVYKAVNTLQSVPWKINTRVLEIMELVWAENIEVGKLIHREKIPDPDKPVDIDTNAEARKTWSQAAGQVRDMNFRAISRRLRAMQTLDIANRFKDDEEIYFPHSLDWRGRLYPIPQNVNPQGDDLARSLLTFKRGEPLGKDGVKWLAIHGANCFGATDKETLDGRVGWVLENREEINECALAPMSNRWWMEAEDPWQFLAFCFEWWGFEGEGADYVCSLPVSLDGACNGTQHFAALLKDVDTAKVVNVLPSILPVDIYQQVCDEVMRLIDDDLVDPGKLDARTLLIAVHWRENVERKTVKRPTMTMAYGATEYGYQEQILNDTLRPLKDADHTHPLAVNHYPAAEYLRKKIVEALGNVVSAAATVMQWLQEVASVAAKEGVPLIWETPTGFLVLQDYKVEKKRQVRTMLAGKKRFLSLRLKGEGDKLNVRKQASGVAPNFIHSLDASHLMMTINRCFDPCFVGVNFHSFGGVHDSYSTVPAHVGFMRDCLRESFAEMYSTDLLAKLKTDLAKWMNDDLIARIPALPERGDLDISQVTKSDFFFA